MTKTQEELNKIKEVKKDTINFRELSDDELGLVLGGIGPGIYVEYGDDWQKNDIDEMFNGKKNNENLNLNNDPLSLEEEFKEKAKVIDLTHF